MASPASKTPPPNSTATSSPSTAQPPSQTLESYAIRQSSPMPLTASQEAEVRELYHANVRSYCAPEIRDFAACCTNRTLSITWACRGQRKAMEKCMNAHAGRAEEDRAREEWFAKVGERRRKKEEDERWKEDQRRLKREWWREYEQGSGR